MVKAKGELKEFEDHLKTSMEQLEENISNSHKGHPPTSLVREELDAVCSLSNLTLASNDPLLYAPSCPANRRPTRNYTGMNNPILLADLAIINHHARISLPPKAADIALGRLKVKGGDMLYEKLCRNVKLCVISIAAPDAFPETDKDTSMLVSLRRLVNLQFKHYNEVERTFSRLVQRFGGGRDTDWESILMRVQGILPMMPSGSDKPDSGVNNKKSPGSLLEGARPQKVSRNTEEVSGTIPPGPTREHTAVNNRKRPGSPLDGDRHRKSPRELHKPPDTTPVRPPYEHTDSYIASDLAVIFHNDVLGLPPTAPELATIRLKKWLGAKSTAMLLSFVKQKIFKCIPGHFLRNEFTMESFTEVMKSSNGADTFHLCLEVMYGTFDERDTWLDIVYHIRILGSSEDAKFQAVAKSVGSSLPYLF